MSTENSNRPSGAWAGALAVATVSVAGPAAYWFVKHVDAHWFVALAFVGISTWILILTGAYFFFFMKNNR